MSSFRLSSPDPSGRSVHLSQQVLEAVPPLTFAQLVRLLPGEVWIGGQHDPDPPQPLFGFRDDV